MTKHRAPLSIDAALARIAGLLPRGWDQMAELTNRKTRTARNWSDPDTPEQIPMDCAITLDLAYQAAGGDGAPIFECYAAQLEMAGLKRFADRIAIGSYLPELIRECAEAEAAAVAASQPGFSDSQRAPAVREIDEAIAAFTRMRAMILTDRADAASARRMPP